MMKFNIEKLHSVQLEILKEFSRICNQENIVFYPFYGSLIGTVRHNGFIPWDDDIDVIVRFKDYHALIQNADRIFKEPYFLQTTDTDKQYNAVFAKLRKSDTTLITKQLCNRDINHGVSIDIYPAIKVADDKKARKKQQFFTKIYFLTHINAMAKNHGKVIEILTGAFARFVPNGIKKKLEQLSFDIITSYEGTDSKKFYVLSGDSKFIYHTYDCSIFKESEPHRFEDIILKIPKDYDVILRKDYGAYKKLPPKQEQGVKLDTFLIFDPDTPYLNYKGKFYCVD